MLNPAALAAKIGSRVLKTPYKPYYIGSVSVILGPWNQSLLLELLDLA